MCGDFFQGWTKNIEISELLCRTEMFHFSLLFLVAAQPLWRSWLPAFFLYAMTDF